MNARERRLVEDLLTVAEAVLESGLHENTIRRHIQKGALPVVRVNRRLVRIRRVDFLRYMGIEDATTSTR